jgi:hypothetical protein
MKILIDYSKIITLTLMDFVNLVLIILLANIELNKVKNSLKEFCNKFNNKNDT